MLIFLYGADSYRSRQKLNQIVNHYQELHPKGLSLKFFDLKKDDFEDFKDQFRTLSMFQETKLLVLKNAFSNKDFKNKFLKRAKEFVEGENVVLFYERDKVSKKNKLFKFLEKNAKCQQFEILNKTQLKNWIEREFKNQGFSIESKARNLLADYVGPDLWRLSNEIKKLVSFKSDTKEETISKSDLQQLVRSKIETDIFKTIDSIADQNQSKALSLLHQHLQDGDSALYLLSMINYQFRNLLQVKDKKRRSSGYISSKKLSKELELHPFVAKKSLGLAKNFSFPQLKKIHHRIFETDLKIKTGQIDPEMALDLLIAGIR